MTFNGEDGAQAYAGVSIDGEGSLYGAAAEGGAYGGVVFKLSPRTNGEWTERILHNFNSKDGPAPYASLIFDRAGNLYGTTSLGGNSKSCGGCGTVFKLSPGANDKWVKTVLHSFNGDDGQGPFLGSIIFGAAGNLYGATNFGGNLTACQNPFSNGCGVVFEVQP
jgi:uncharacterized repeat protein (TIGR03803 family)